VLVTRQVSLDTVREAAAHVYRAAVRTPLVRLEVPGPADIYLKLETLQPIGSFKIRGAYNAVRQLPPSALREGVWTVSAGNAAQGVALAARLAGAACSVMVMDTAPDTKLQAIARLGATIVKAPYEECWRTVEEHGSERMRGTFVHPFDDDRFISGNGTIGLEIVEDLPDVDAIVAPLGGGGLLSGIACAARALRPGVKVFAAEPETAAPLSSSLAAGKPGYFPGWRPSFVDGAGGRSVLPSMWPFLSEWIDGSIVVSLDEAARAMRMVAERARVIAEGAAACAVAAALRGGSEGPGGGGSERPAPRGGPERSAPRKIVAVVSGGNIDLSRFAEIVGACART
jgi:threonine dehydratase